MGNKKGRLAVQILLFLIVIVLSSATVLSLVKFGILTPKTDNNANLLNTNFVPFTRSGTLVLEEFNFCTDIDNDYNCVSPKTVFNNADTIHFRFTVKSTVQDGVIMLVENYRLFNPSGDVILEAEDKDNFHFQQQSRKDVEEVIFKDHFKILNGPNGVYTLELVLTNPLIDKKVEVVEQFRLQ